MTMRRWIPTLASAAAVALLAPAAASASTWTVDDDHVQCPNAGFSTVQGAINQAAPWDTVVVCAGDYAEAINTPNSTNSPAQAGSKAALLITKPLTIRGVAPLRTMTAAPGLSH